MFEYKLTRSHRKTLALYIAKDGSLDVRAPLKMPEKVIEEFIRSKQAWIDKNTRKLQQNKQVPKTYTEGEVFYYLGEQYRLVFINRDKPIIELSGDLLIAERFRNRAEKVITYWYKEEAEEILRSRVKVYAAEMQLQPNSVRISNANQRWGSCSIKGTINLSWRLVMAPLDIIDYVVVHELAHMHQHNHSRAFWQVVESILPDYKTRRQWLRQNGHLISL